MCVRRITPRYCVQWLCRGMFGGTQDYRRPNDDASDIDREGEDSSRDIWDTGSTGLSHRGNVVVSCRGTSKHNCREPAFFSRASVAETPERQCRAWPTAWTAGPFSLPQILDSRFQRLWAVRGQGFWGWCIRSSGRQPALCYRHARHPLQSMDGVPLSEKQL